MGEKQDRIDIKNIMVLLGVGLLSPMIRVLPRRSAVVAGEAGWLAVLVALGPLLVTMGCVFWAVHRLPEGEGLGELLIRAFGEVLGRLVCGLYFLWLLLSMCAALRLYGERFLSTAYSGTPLYLFFAVLLGLELWISRGGLGAFARMGKIFAGVLGVTVVLAMLFSLPNMRRTNLLPIWFDDAPEVLRSSVPALSNLGVGIFFFFLSGQVSKKPENRRIAMGWTAGYCVMLALLSLVIIGCFGPELVTRLQVPFFALVKEIEIYGAIDRVESLVVAVWVFTDVVLIGLLARTACAALCHALKLKRERRLATPILFFLFPGGFLVADNMFSLMEAYNGLAMAIDLALAYGIPLLACLLAKVRGRI